MVKTIPVEGNRIRFLVVEVFLSGSRRSVYSVYIG